MSYRMSVILWETILEMSPDASGFDDSELDPATGTLMLLSSKYRILTACPSVSRAVVVRVM